jgi:hypothetical protein
MTARAFFRVLFSLFLIFVTSVCCFSQREDLCQGAYFTEQQGQDHLLKLQGRINSQAAWKLHADSIRIQLRKGLELEKFPSKTPLNPKFRNKLLGEGYTVESVVFESMPGFYVTGNLYRPTGNSKPKSLAVIACPHGHASNPADYGRFRRDMQLRCASFAKMGAIVFSYDMVGYGESQQLDHKYEKVLIFQTINGIRIIDFLLSFPEADPERVAVTGASGGGTQTFLTVALDERVKVSAPVVMVSSHFFGGCSCESGLPIHRAGKTIHTNAEIACLAAPRPMILVSDGGDWTSNTPLVEFPFAQHIYSLFGVKDKVENAHFASEKHDYGVNKRLAVYNFFSKHLGLDLSKISVNGKVDERFVKIFERKDLEYFEAGETSSLMKGDQVYQAFAKTKK